MPKKRWVKVNIFLTKLLRWEYWPFSILYFPVFFYYAYLIVKTRSFFFFTAANPSIEFGGMFGEKKSNIFSLIPNKYLPATKLVRKGESQLAATYALEIGYPLIAKPDIGERGNWVKKINDQDELDNYVQACPVDFLLQELVDYPVELGLFYVKIPGKKGRVTSIVRKDFLSVLGDGYHTINELLRDSSRALLTANLESEFLKKYGNDVLEEGRKVIIEPIGNHCRGTKFLNDGHEIDEPLVDAIDQLAGTIPDFYFGRFDLKCKSVASLRELKDFKILELNGAGSEPGHIYQPGYSLFSAYKDILWHLHLLADISIRNHKRGIPYWDFRKGYRKWRDHKKYNLLLSDL